MEHELKRVRSFLCRYHDAAMNIESLIAEKEKLESAIFSITTSYDKDGGGSGSVVGDKMAEQASRLTDLVERIEGEIESYEHAREEVRRVVRRVKDINIVYGQDLHYRYIDWRGAVQTALDMGYSESHERAIHRKALMIAHRFI